MCLFLGEIIAISNMLQHSIMVYSTPSMKKAPVTGQIGTIPSEGLLLDCQITISNKDYGQFDNLPCQMGFFGMLRHYYPFEVDGDIVVLDGKNKLGMFLSTSLN